jgi:hypothetical protein
MARRKRKELCLTDFSLRRLPRQMGPDLVMGGGDLRPSSRERANRKEYRSDSVTNLSHKAMRAGGRSLGYVLAGGSVASLMSVLKWG